MPAHLLIFALDATVVFGALLLSAGNLLRLPGNRNALLVSALLIGQVCVTVLGRYQYGYWIPEPYRIDVGAWEPLLNIGRNMGPGLFMLLCHSLFQEPRRFPRWLLALFVLQLLLEEPIHLFVGAEAHWRWLTEAVPGTLEALFAGFAVYWTIAGWSADLVESRRRLRWVVILIAGVAMIASVLLQRMLIPWDSAYNYFAHVFFTAVCGVLLSAVALVLLGRHGVEHYLQLDATDSPTQQPSPPPASAADDTPAEVAELQRLMTEERVYRQAGLSVASLAAQMGMPEYRLRKLIHRQLGYRNFNAFLHDYRVGEACEMLHDPGQARTPILTIALSVGYQSINTFNRGFREVTGITPSAFRSSGVPPSRSESAQQDVPT